MSFTKVMGLAAIVSLATGCPATSGDGQGGGGGEGGGQTTIGPTTPTTVAADLDCDDEVCDVSGCTDVEVKDSDPCPSGGVCVRGECVTCESCHPGVCQVAYCLDGKCVILTAPDNTPCSEGVCTSGRCVD